MAVFSNDHSKLGILLDDCSNISLIWGQGELASSLLPNYTVINPDATACISTATGTTTYKGKQVQFTLDLCGSSTVVEAFHISEHEKQDPPGKAYMCRHLSSRLKNFLPNPVLAKLNHEMNYFEHPTVLLGMPFSQAFLGNFKIYPEEPFLRVHTSSYGYIIKGNFTRDCNYCPYPKKQSNTVHVSTAERLCRILEKQVAITEYPLDDVTGMSVQDVQDIEYMKETLSYCPKEKRYTSRLLFLNPKQKPFLPNNYRMALNRYLALERKLQKESPEIQKLYSDSIMEHIISGKYKVVPEAEALELADLSRSDVFYMSHRGVYRENHVGHKLRVVFNASMNSANGNPDLNSFLSKGPAFMPKVNTLILRFRQYKVIFSLDISRLFLQVNCYEPEQNLQLFLFRLPGDTKISTIKVASVCWGLKDSPWKLHFVMQTLCQPYLKSKCPWERKASEFLTQSLYIDDVLCGADSAESALKLFDAIKTILAKASFVPSKVFSNSSQFLASIPEKMRGPTKDSLNLNMASDYEICDSIQSQESTCLGLRFDPQKDMFTFSKADHPSLKKEITTKTDLASVLGALGWDPSGATHAFSLKIKILSQELNKMDSKLAWRATIPKDIQDKAQEVIKDVGQLSYIQIPRYLNLSKPDHQFICFADAGNHAYGAVCYLRYYDETSNTIKTNFVIAKGRCLPIKISSIVRAEILALLCAVDLIKQIQDAYGLQDTAKFKLFTDSAVCFYYARKPLELLIPWVSNRMRILRNMNLEVLWVDGCSNPADLIARSSTPSEINSTFFLYGPAFLKTPSHCWPSCHPEKETCLTSTEYLAGLRTEKTALTLATNISAPKPDRLPDFAESLYQYSNDLNLMLLHTGLLYLFIARCRYKIQLRKNKKAKTSNAKPVPPTLRRCMEHAFIFFVHHVQKLHFSEEFKSLTKGEALFQKSKLLPYNPFLCQQGKLPVIRSADRAVMAPDQNFSNRYKYMLPSQSKFVFQIIEFTHKIFFPHASVSTMLYHIGTYAHILQAKKTIQKYFRSCSHCMRFFPKQMTSVMGPHPKIFQLKDELPLSVLSTDLLGPLACKDDHNPRRTFSVYIIIFCCLNTNFTQCQILYDISAESLLLCLNKLASLYGFYPKFISCDNGSNLRRMTREIKELFFSPRNREILEREGLKRNFTVTTPPPGTPFLQSKSESRVKLFKSALARSLLHQTMTYYELESILASFCFYVNNRPLGSISATENHESVTSFSLVFGRHTQPFVFDNMKNFAATGANANTRSRWEKRHQILNHFQNLYFKKILQNSSNIKRYKWQRSGSETVKVGDVFLTPNIKSDLTGDKTYKWPMFRVTKILSRYLVQGLLSDNIFSAERQVQRLKDPKNDPPYRAKLVTRNIHNLYALEAFPNETNSLFKDEVEDGNKTISAQSYYTKVENFYKTRESAQPNLQQMMW